MQLGSTRAGANWAASLCRQRGLLELDPLGMQRGCTVLACRRRTKRQQLMRLSRAGRPQGQTGSKWRSNLTEAARGTRSEPEQLLAPQAGKLTRPHRHQRVLACLQLAGRSRLFLPASPSRMRATVPRRQQLLESGPHRSQPHPASAALGLTMLRRGSAPAADQRSGTRDRFSIGRARPHLLSPCNLFRRTRCRLTLACLPRQAAVRRARPSATRPWRARSWAPRARAQAWIWSSRRSLLPPHTPMLQPRPQRSPARSLSGSKHGEARSISHPACPGPPLMQPLQRSRCHNSPFRGTWPWTTGSPLLLAGRR